MYGGRSHDLKTWRGGEPKILRRGKNRAGGTEKNSREESLRDFSQDGGGGIFFMNLH